jgi:TPR repeat protein
LGTGINKRTAFYWYEKAARHGQADAQYRLGRLYESGEGVKKDMKRAAHWYRRAARNGNKEAKLRLAGTKTKALSAKDSKETNSSKKYFDLTTLWN